MFKKILQASAQALLSRPKIIRLAFFTLLCFSIVRLYYIIYYFNTILIWKYESGVQVSDALMYFISTLHAHHAVGTIIIAVLIIIVGYLWLYPIGQASVIYALHEPEKSNFSAFSKGLGRFFPMLEYGGLSIPFGLFTFCTVVLRLYLINVLGNVVVDILIGIWGIMVLFASIFWSYAKVIIVLDGVQVFDAIKKSTKVAFLNLGLSIKLMLVEFFLLFRFLITGALIVGIPLGIVYIAVWLNILDNSFVEGLIRVVAGSLLLFLSYINCIVETYFLTYWYQAYKTIALEKEK